MFVEKNITTYKSIQQGTLIDTFCIVMVQITRKNNGCPSTYSPNSNAYNDEISNVCLKTFDSRILY